MNQLLFVWTTSFWWFSCLAGLPIALPALIIFLSADLAVNTFYPVMLSVHFLLHQHYFPVLVAWPAHFPSISVLDIHCFLCLNIAFIHSLHATFLGHTTHTTLNGLITKSAPAQPILTQLTQQKGFNAKSRYHVLVPLSVNILLYSTYPNKAC